MSAIFCDNLFKYINENTIYGNGNYIKGDYNTVIGYGNIVVGKYNKVHGDYCRVYGRNCRIDGFECFVEGIDNSYTARTQPQKTSRPDSPITQAWRPISPIDSCNYRKISTAGSSSDDSRPNSPSCSPSVRKLENTFRNLSRTPSGTVEPPKKYKVINCSSSDLHTSRKSYSAIHTKSAIASPIKVELDGDHETPTHTEIEKLLKGLRLKQFSRTIEEE